MNMRDNANVTSLSPSMDSPLQLIRDLLPFSQPHADSKATKPIASAGASLESMGRRRGMTDVRLPRRREPGKSRVSAPPG